ncbi:energy transducer TonB [Chitinophaga vietnamensis]|uniref:energy transducer TonB n=1 Tax=Chitinophaga vietnamensis TaxID=2593957 RepID=UPI001178C97C|nr:energy transducer TonB [Chitinophaga vietnamensis]
MVTFVIDTNGMVIGKGIHGKKEAAYTSLDKVVLRILDEMPRWKPGRQNGKKVAVRFQLPMFICQMRED